MTDVLATRGETVLGEESAAEAATATASSHTGVRVCIRYILS